MDRALQDVIDQARAIYADALPEGSGVAHVVSSVRVGDRWHVIDIGDQAPKSARDFFVLNFARAQCDAILTTARVIRAEPRLSHELQGEYAAGLRAYRETLLGKREPPLVAILTASGELSPQHRVFRDRARNVVLTREASAPPLRAALDGLAEVVGFEALDARRAIAWLQQRGANMILIEAGPSTACGLYDAPSLVDQLRLSRCEAAVRPAAIGGALPSDERLFAGLTQRSDTAFDEVSGRWRFQHWTR